MNFSKLRYSEKLLVVYIPIQFRISKFITFLLVQKEGWPAIQLVLSHQVDRTSSQVLFLNVLFTKVGRERIKSEIYVDFILKG